MSGIVAESHREGQGSPASAGGAGAETGGCVDTLHLGLTLRSLYEGSVDKQPIPDSQVDLILRLRSKERALRHAN